MKKFFINIALLIFTVLLCFLLLEAGIRLFFPVINISILDKEIFVKDDILGYVLKPNVDITKETLGQVYATRSNSDGLRNDKDYTKGAHPGIFRIVGLGDSVTYGFGVNIEETYLKVLEAKLSKNTKKKVEVINAAFPGWSIAQELLFLKTQGIEYKPDFIIIGFVDDDIFRNQEYYNTAMSLDSQDVAKKEVQKTPLDKSWIQNFLLAKTKFYPFILSKIKYLRNRNFLDFSLNQTKNLFKELNKFCQKNKIKYLVAVIPLREKESKINNLMVEFFKDNEMPYLDLRENFLKREGELYLVKDNHPNAEGHKLVANGIYDYLQQRKLVKR